ncbi:MAG: type II toxin-antitoxin system RelE/ParE family toxin [Nitrospirota bacterium]
MKPFLFHPEALMEADESARFYEERQEGLGKRFIEALTDTINRIIRNPKLYIKIDDTIRKCRLLHFPYGVIYRDINEFIEIIAVMHLKREPGYWKSRI